MIIIIIILPFFLKISNFLGFYILCLVLLQMVSALLLAQGMMSNLDLVFKFLYVKNKWLKTKNDKNPEFL